MTSEITEWEFTGDVVSWINEHLAAHPGLPFSRAKTEQRGVGQRKRRDLTLLGSDGNVVLTAEFKLPDRIDGASPFHTGVVTDARKKAKVAKSPYFLTWNVNTAVLWDSSSPVDHPRYRVWSVTTVQHSNELLVSSVQATIRDWLHLFLMDFADLLRGANPLGSKAPDVRFVEGLEAALEVPIQLTVEALDKRYGQQRFREQLNQWMRADQGWVIYDDPSGIQDNLQRAAKFTVYSLVNKLVFYEALLKRYGKSLEKIQVPAHITTGEQLRSHFEGFFAKARRVTHDYETVFGEDTTGMGGRVPFYADGAVSHWRSLIESIHEFDFSRLDYEVIGSIFERLISPEERHKYGQFYTRVEVVDLINAFCMPTGHETVLDPACGGGTFLVRAYARKRELAAGDSHAERLASLFGIDISPFATHLTTINLATRDLVEDDNYPQVARSDFFDISPEKSFVSLPKSLGARGLGKHTHREVLIPPLDAVVANPPYVRQEDILRTPKGRPSALRGTKEFYRQLVERESGVKLGGRSDLHCYFWLHASQFLKATGRLGFVTSSQWLDVEYGFPLQGWILSNFRIVAILEALDEPWFVGARVATTVTILERCASAADRAANQVRFIQFRKPVAEILAHDGTTAGAIAAADAFRDELMAAETDTSDDRYRLRLVAQGSLLEEGIALAEVLKKSSASTESVDTDEEDEETASESQRPLHDPHVAGVYAGGKWGVFVRAPDLWFKLIDEHSDRLVPLGTLAAVRFGVKSGNDSFFMPKDVSAECLDSFSDAADFELEYGVPRKVVAKGEVKLVGCGEKLEEIRPVESRFLEPEVHSLMEVERYEVRVEDCRRMILLVSESKRQLRGTYVADYISWGEQQGVHRGSTVAARATAARAWYDLTGQARGALFWPKAQQYRHIAPQNRANLQANCNLYDIHLPQDIDVEVMAGILNSTITLFSKHQFGRPVGVEGNLKTEVVDTLLMRVPDPRQSTAADRKRVAAAFRRLRERPVMGLLSERRLRRMAYTARGDSAALGSLSDETELDKADRHDLDDAVLQLLGMSSPAERGQFRADLYSYLRGFFEATRSREERAIQNKKTSKRAATAKPETVAQQILEAILAEQPGLGIPYDGELLDASKPFDTVELPTEGAPEYENGLFEGHAIAFRKGKKVISRVVVAHPEQGELVIALSRSGHHGFVRVPHESEEARRVNKSFELLQMRRDEVITRLIEDRIADSELQDEVRGILDQRFAAMG